MRRCLAAFMGVVLPLAAEDQKNPDGERTYHEMSKESKPWWDTDTGFGLPHRLGTFKMQDWLEYKDKALGCSVRMVDDEAQARADVYVYPCPVPSTTEGEIQQALGDELGRSLSGVYAMQKRGDYSDVKRQDATMQTVMLMPSGSLPLIGCVVTMKIHD